MYSITRLKDTNTGRIGLHGSILPFPRAAIRIGDVLLAERESQKVSAAFLAANAITLAYLIDAGVVEVRVDAPEATEALSSVGLRAEIRSKFGRRPKSIVGSPPKKDKADPVPTTSVPDPAEPSSVEKLKDGPKEVVEDVKEVASDPPRDLTEAEEVLAEETAPVAPVEVPEAHPEPEAKLEEPPPSEEVDEKKDPVDTYVAPPKSPYKMKKTDLVDWLEACGFERDDLESMSKPELAKFGSEQVDKHGGA